MAEDVIGVPTDEQALALVGGGDRDISDGEKERIAQQIQDAARANAGWRSSLPFEQQMALANVPVSTYPPSEAESNKESVGENTGQGVPPWERR